MRLLQLEEDGTFSLVSFIGKDERPAWAILSHVWGQDGDEVTFEDLRNGEDTTKRGYEKLRFCAEQAARDEIRHFWIDTCSIDKSSSQELSEAITSMFRWYQDSTKCYVYLSDVSIAKRKADSEAFSCPWEPAFRQSKWFTRGWTLQELLAPASVEFFSSEGIRLGDKRSLKQQIHEITDIAIPALEGTPLDSFSIEERLSWARNRHTKREEDKAYSLLGICGVSMIPHYGEGEEHALKRLHKEIKESQSDLPSTLNEHQRDALMESLRFNQLDARQMTIRNAHSKTCKWLLQKSEYLEWLDPNSFEKHHGFLWIKGKPGTGKSTIMKYALNAYKKTVKKTVKKTIVISFFFNARGEELEKSTLGTYRSLLVQLLEARPDLQRIIASPGIARSVTSGYFQWSIALLESVLEEAIQGLEKASVTCFIDALDECDEDQVRSMLRFFQRLGEVAVSSHSRFQVCFSSRHYPHITIDKGLDLILEGQEGHDQDITNYLDSELNIGTGKVATQIRSELQEKASGIFMWVVLVVGILNKEYDRGRIHALKRRLMDIPGDLHDLFRDILTRDSNDKQELLLCIQWVLFTRHPLKPEQLYFAILAAVDPDAILDLYPQDYEPPTGRIMTKDLMVTIERFIIDASKGLLEITTSKIRKVQFIHESVRDFLFKEGSLATIWPDLKSNLEGQSHEQLKRCCIEYLNSRAVHPLTIYLMDLVPVDRERFLSDFPFLEYAVQNVIYHADTAAGCGINQTEFFDKFDLKKWSLLHTIVEKHRVRHYTAYLNLPYILGEQNCAHLIRDYPHDFSCIEQSKERYGPPLFAALALGNKEAVDAFLERMIPNAPDGSELCEVHTRGSDGVPFGRTFRFLESRTIASYLAEFGHQRVLSALLSRNVQLDLNKPEAGTRMTLLMWAASRGHAGVVQLLLDQEMIDVDSQNELGETPLFLAVARGHSEVVRLLLNTGKADVEAFDGLGRTPLFLATSWGHAGIVEVLLAAKANPYSRGPGNDRLSAISQAQTNANGVLVRLMQAYCPGTTNFPFSSSLAS
ncbi:hypothetical protein IQ07DRAFT_554869 [Pyrenochaeta sp. DS3sAY3a]|nr:hypothetical protein IQ07DRAFT_554869 [Pyrenochaeta sp. DS3sAY3a]